MTETASRNALLPGEDPVAYQAHLRGYQLEYQPQDPYQHHLVDELASLAWRIDRVPVFEASLISLEVHRLTTDPELQPLIAGLHTESELAAVAYRRLVEGKVLTSQPRPGAAYLRPHPADQTRIEPT